jgi:hypothetical protein
MNSNQKYTVVTDDQGTTRYFKPGTDELHRLDGPAVVFANGDRLWYKDGQLHRVAGPAIDPIRGKKA